MVPSGVDVAQKVLGDGRWFLELQSWMRTLCGWGGRGGGWLLYNHTSCLVHWGGSKNASVWEPNRKFDSAQAPRCFSTGMGQDPLQKSAPLRRLQKPPFNFLFAGAARPRSSFLLIPPALHVFPQVQTRDGAQSGRAGGSGRRLWSRVCLC